MNAIVTGAASGIGAATVSRLREEGYRVAALDLDAARLERVDAEVRLVADASDVDAIANAVAEAVVALGGLDVAVACAGIAPTGTVIDTTPAVWDRIMAVNVRGVYALARAAMPHLAAKGDGAFVAVASQLGIVAAASSAAYCASKGAVINLIRAMAIDHGPSGVRINCVCPGPTDTPLARDYFAGQANPEATLRAFEAMGAHGRLTRPDEIADAIAFLASARASSIHGAALVVDAGFTIR